MSSIKKGLIGSKLKTGGKWKLTPEQLESMRYSITKKNDRFWESIHQNDRNENHQPNSPAVINQLLCSFTESDDLTPIKIQVLPVLNIPIPKFWTFLGDPSKESEPSNLSLAAGHANCMMQTPQSWNSHQCIKQRRDRNISTQDANQRTLLLKLKANRSSQEPFGAVRSLTESKTPGSKTFSRSLCKRKKLNFCPIREVGSCDVSPRASKSLGATNNKLTIHKTSTQTSVVDVATYADLPQRERLSPEDWLSCAFPTISCSRNRSGRTSYARRE